MDLMRKEESAAGKYVSAIMSFRIFRNFNNNKKHSVTHKKDVQMQKSPPTESGEKFQCYQISKNNYIFRKHCHIFMRQNSFTNGLLTTVNLSKRKGHEVYKRIDCYY